MNADIFTNLKPEPQVIKSDDLENGDMIKVESLPEKEHGKGAKTYIADVVLKNAIGITNEKLRITGEQRETFIAGSIYQKTETGFTRMIPA